MNKFFKKYYLLGVLFITGAAVLVIEVTATRILSPFFGQTVYSVSSILSVILAALSFGYYYGGILADKKPSEKLFFQIIAFSGIATIAIQFLSDILSPIIASSLPFKYGPLVLSILLFFLPALLLGMLSPFVIKIQSIKLKKIGVGRVSGQVFFVPTLGSIFGSLLAGFFLIPTFGLSQIILGCGLLLVILGLIGSKFNLSLFFAIFLVAAVFFRIGVSTASVIGSDIVYAKDSVYQKIIVKDLYNQGQIDRHLFLDRNNSAAIRLGSKDLVFEYFKYYSLYKYFNGDPKNIAVIGGGGYVLPQVYAEELPDADIDVVEIDPNLYEVSKKYFILSDDPRVVNHVEDGRAYLEKSDKKYDLIFLDAYAGLTSIPDHLTTKEFFDLLRSKLSPDGIVIANVVGDLEIVSPSLTYSLIKTFKQAFDNTYYFATQTAKVMTAQNLLFVASNSNIKPDFSSYEFRQNQFTVDNKILEDQKLLTDNYSPVEFLVAGMLERMYSN